MRGPHSYLFVPGTNLAVIKKAVSSEADRVIIDLEDAVALTEKNQARKTVKEALKTLGNEKNILVRINGLDTPHWEEDLACAVRNGAEGVMVPKSESGSDMQTVSRKIRELAKEHQSNLEIIPLIETAKGIQFAYEIAAADSMVSRLAFGSIDFSLDIGCELTRDGLELLFARSQIVIASRAAGLIPPIDAVYPELANEEGLERETRFARQLGFKAKLSIHPKQLNVIHSVFTPSIQEQEKAEKVIEAFEAAEQRGVASVTVDNTFVDYPVYQKAKETLSHFSGNARESKS